MMKCPKCWLFIAAASFSVCFFASEAHADLIICNDTKSRIGVALGYKDEGGWGSEGWWNIGADQCQPVLKGALVSEHYYVHAVDYDLGGEWSGDHKLCIKSDAFTIRSSITCTQNGWETAGFFRIATKSSKNWVVRLSDDNAKTQDVEPTPDNPS